MAETSLFNKVRDDDRPGETVEIIDISASGTKTLDENDIGKTFHIRSSHSSGVTYVVTLGDPLLAPKGASFKFVKEPPFGDAGDTPSASTAGNIKLTVKPAGGDILYGGASDDESSTDPSAAEGLVLDYDQRKGELEVVSDSGNWHAHRFTGVWDRE